MDDEPKNRRSHKRTKYTTHHREHFIGSSSIIWKYIKLVQDLQRKFIFDFEFSLHSVSKKMIKTGIIHYVHKVTETELLYSTEALDKIPFVPNFKISKLCSQKVPSFYVSTICYWSLNSTISSVVPHVQCSMCKNLKK